MSEGITLSLISATLIIALKRLLKFALVFVVTGLSLSFHQ